MASAGPLDRRERRVLGVEIRDFAPSDREETRDLILRGLRERWGADFDPSFNSDLDDMGASYLATGGQVIVAIDGRTIVGTGTLMVEPGDRVVRLVRMSTDPQHRRRGIARGIVDELIRRARTGDYDHMLVETDTPWTSAVRLYQSCGFQITEQDDANTYFMLALR